MNWGIVLRRWEVPTLLCRELLVANIGSFLMCAGLNEMGRGGGDVVGVRWFGLSTVVILLLALSGRVCALLVLLTSCELWGNVFLTSVF